MRLMLSTLLAVSLYPAGVALADPVTVVPVTVTDWKAVYGTIEARDRTPARARLGGTLVELLVAEGDMVIAGQDLARIVDDKLDLQLDALAARREALAAQLANAEADLKRGEDLLNEGVTTTQRIEALRTGVDVLKGQLASLDAEGEVIRQQAKEGTVLAANAKAGTCVEIKNSTVGENSKVPHLSYIGDATIGAGVNIGAGSITCNYDGVAKHPTFIGDGAFIGSDTMLVAPVTVGAGAVTAAGSTIARDVPEDALAIERSEQVTIERWAARRGKRTE
jgi:multidrug efflux pump subunit AcrA (membrane-fusion protein)